MTLIASSPEKDSVAEQDSLETNAPNATTDTPEEIVVSSVFIGQKPVLRNWKVMADGPQLQDDVAGFDDEEKNASPLAERSYSDRRINTARPVASVWLQTAQAFAVFLTVAWITYAAIYIMALPGSVKAITSSPLTLGGILASVLAPVAMMWLCIATWQRRSDANLYAQALKEELRSMIFPSAEETSLLNEDIRQMMKQAADMSASSRASIKAIQRARSGLRAELRDFSGVTQKAEFHIDRLTDTLGKRAEELLSLTETIEAQSTVIADKAQRGVTSWENISAEISELSEEVDGIFTSGTVKLTAASDEAVDKIKAIEVALLDAVQNLSQKIGNVADQIDTTSHTLDSQADKLGAVSQSIKGGAERLEDSLIGAEKISQAVEGVMDVMSASLGKVEQTAENLITRTETIEKRLEERADTLKESAEKLLENTNGLQQVGDIATHKLGEALSMAISGADTITSAVRKSRDMMEKSAQEAQEQITLTTRLSDEKFSELAKSAQDHRNQLNQLLAELDAKRSAIDNAVTGLEKTQETVVDAAVRTQESLLEAAEAMQEKSQRPLSLINESIDRLAAQTVAIDDKIAVRVAEVGQETSKLKQIGETLATSLKESTQEMSVTLGEVKSQSRIIDEELAAQRQAIKSMLADIEETAAGASDVIKSRHEALQEAFESSEEQIENLGVKFFDRGDALLQKMEEASSNVVSYEGKLVDVLQAIDITSLKTESSLRHTIETLSDLSAKAEPQCHIMVEKANLLNERYTQLQENLVTTGDMALSCLSDMGESLDQRFEKLGASTMETSKSMLELTDNLTISLRDIRTVSQDTQERLAQIQTGVKGRTDDLQLITDQVRLKVDALHTNLETHIKSLGTVVGKAISDLDDATEQFGESTQLLDRQAENAVAKLAAGSRQYIEESRLLAEVGEQAVRKAAGVVQALRDESVNLVDASRMNLGELQKTGETLSVRAQEIETYLKGSLTIAQNYGEEMRAQAAMIAEQSSVVADTIANSTSRLVSKVAEIQNQSQDAVSNIEESRQKLSAEGSRLESYTRSAIAAVDETGNVFSKHSANLYKSVAEMADQAKKFRESQLRIERESFLSAAKFVIESLYSLAVDVSRHLENDVDDRIMRAYQKGDVAAYVRHLAEIAPRMPLDKAQRKFIEDSEFRVYVLRFIRQFEELLEQSQANDYADLLSSVFSTSDIGKLYKVLCEIAGRSAKEH